MSVQVKTKNGRLGSRPGPHREAIGSLLLMTTFQFMLSMQHRTVLEYQRYRYLKLALLVIVGAIVAYAYQRAPVGRYGGTLVGYVLGTIGALIILWLMWFGVRKRQYKASGASVQDWLSAHVYLGLTLIVVATLHAAFQVGWNVHTLAYVLMMMVIASGIFGMYAYLRFPAMTTENMAEDTLDGVLLKISDLDREAKKLALAMPENLLNAVTASVQSTQIGGGVYAQIRAKHPNCPTNQAVALLEAVNKGRAFKGEQAQVLHELYAVMLRKQKLVARARRDVRFKALMDLWLYFHVPLSFALLAALIAHIVSVFFYW